MALLYNDNSGQFSAIPVLINTLTAVNSASLDDTTSISSTYSSYLLILSGIIPATLAQTLLLQVHSGGAFKSTTYLTRSSEFGAAYAGSAAITSGIPLTAGDFATGAAGPGYFGSIVISNPQQASTPKHIYSHGAYTTSGAIANVIGSGYWNGGNGAIDGFRLINGLGNLVSGIMEVYALP